MNITHEEFVNDWNNGKIDVSVDQTKALDIANANVLPKRYQYAHLFWSWIWMLSMPAGFAVMYFFEVWQGILILCFSYILYKSVRKSAMQFMIDHALENPRFYDAACSSDLINIKHRE